MSRLTTLVAVFVLHTATAFATGEGEADLFRPRLYAFENGVSFGSLEDEAKTLKVLGYDGISQVQAGGVKLSERIAAYDKAGLHVLSVYLNVSDKPIAAEVVEPLKNRGALIELTVKKITPNTVNALRQTAEMAAKLNIRVALYPHHGFAVAKVSQALDLIEKVDHPNLGMMFNLCHFLKGERVEDLEASLEMAHPHLFAVTTSGADIGGRSWGDLIKPLDQGNFPQDRLFRTLKKIDFNGPVGLQCYGIRGDKRTNLKRSIAAWNAIFKEL